MWATGVLVVSVCLAFSLAVAVAPTMTAQDREKKALLARAFRNWKVLPVSRHVDVREQRNKGIKEIGALAVKLLSLRSILSGHVIFACAPFD